MNQVLEVRKTSDGKVFARRKDGLPLTEEDREKAKTVAGEVEPLPHSWVAEDIRDGQQLRAVKICSALLEDHLWLILDRSFESKDNLAIYYPEELAIIATKSQEELREIHNVKLKFPGCRVIQDGIEGSSR